MNLSSFPAPPQPIGNHGQEQRGKQADHEYINVTSCVQMGQAKSMLSVTSAFRSNCLRWRRKSEAIGASRE